MINVLLFTFIEKYGVAMRCYGYCSLVHVDRRKSKLKDIAYSLRHNSSCSLLWSKHLCFRPLAPGLKGCLPD